MELLVLLLAGACIGLTARLWHVRKGTPREDGRELIREAASVTADFLEAGQVVSLLSDGNYLGTISLRPQQRKHNQVGYAITMYDSGNLREAYGAYRKSHPEVFQRETEAFRVLEQFLNAYGGCYDRERNALVYQTKHSASPSVVREGETELQNRIRIHPLAQMDSLSQIHTKYLGRP